MKTNLNASPSRRPLNPILFTIFTLFMLILLGCGGGSIGKSGGSGGGGSSSGGGSGSGSATFQIIWPARSRAALTNPLTSSLSAQVTLVAAGNDGSDVVTVANRDLSKLDGYTGTYKVAKSVRSGSKTVSVRFYSLANATGAVVGTASGTAEGDKTVDLGSVALSGTVSTVRVDDVSVEVGSGETQLLFSAKDASGNLIAVTPGSASWSLTAGNDRVSLSEDGVVTPGAVGTAKVRASVDGIASGEATVTVTPKRPAAGTVRLQNGPILKVVGTCAQAVRGSSNTLQTFKITKSDGSTETVSNTLITGDIGVNDPVVLLRQGTQPVQGTFTDSSRLFYILSDGNYKVPISTSGVFTVSVAMKSISSLRTESPFTVSGLVVEYFSWEGWYSDDPRHFVPLSYVLDVPLPGQSMNKVSGSVQYDSMYALHQFVNDCSYTVSGRAYFNQNLSASGTLEYSNSKGSSDLAQGNARISLSLN